MLSFHVQTTRNQEMIDISEKVQHLVTEHGGSSRLCIVYIPHTTAAVTINEHADPDVKRDILFGLNLLVPDQTGFHHREGNSAAHIKSSLLGASQSVPVEKGHLQLGTWQGIFLAEFDGPRQRSVYVQLV
ncbi:MAG TPA: secondary thiamine-phosphate synthase enzyme YjbQ [Syntrophomonadaceae bacterium]|nr:secondary thiamine-phosphate synthase enzyme YjbQ [Syntrophomonadaceae bacterium]